MLTVELDLRQNKEIRIENIDGIKRGYYNNRLVYRIYAIKIHQFNRETEPVISTMEKRLEDEITFSMPSYMLCLGEFHACFDSCTRKMEKDYCLEQEDEISDLEAI